MKNIEVCAVVNVVKAPNLKKESRYWILDGKKIPVSNKVHNCLRNGKAKIFYMENKEKEITAYSLQNLEGMDGLEAKSIEEFRRNEDLEIIKLILEDALRKLTAREMFLLYAIFYERTEIAEIAAHEKTYQNKIKREVKKALEHLKQILWHMGICQMSDLM